MVRMELVNSPVSSDSVVGKRHVTLITHVLCIAGWHTCWYEEWCKMSSHAAAEQEAPLMACQHCCSCRHL